MSQQPGAPPPPHKRPYAGVTVTVSLPQHEPLVQEFKYVAGAQVGEGATTLFNQDMKPIAQFPTDYSVVVWPDHDTLAALVVPAPRPQLVVPGPSKLQ